MKTYTIRWRKDLDYQTPEEPALRGVSFETVTDWLDARGDDGTFIIIDDATGLPVPAEDFPES